MEAREDLGGPWDLFEYPGLCSDSDLYTINYDRHGCGSVPKFQGPKFTVKVVHPQHSVDEHMPSASASGRAILRGIFA